jgi:hypothetical protein
MSSHDAFAASGTSPTRRDQIPSRPDFMLENHSSIFLLRPQTGDAVTWLDENIGQNSGFQPYWPTVVVEHRFIGPIAEGIVADGLVIGAKANNA